MTKRAFILKRYGIIMKIDANSYFDHASENIDCKSFAIRNKISPSEAKIVNSLKTLHFSKWYWSQLIVSASSWLIQMNWNVLRSNTINPNFYFELMITWRELFEISLLIQFEQMEEKFRWNFREYSYFDEKFRWIKSESACICFAWLPPSHSKLDQNVYSRVLESTDC